MSVKFSYWYIMSLSILCVTIKEEWWKRERNEEWWRREGESEEEWESRRERGMKSDGGEKGECKVRKEEKKGWRERERERERERNEKWWGREEGRMQEGGR